MFRTYSSRLVFRSLAAFTLIMGVVFTLLIPFQKGRLREDFDQSLFSRLDVAITAIEAQAKQSGRLGLIERIESASGKYVLFTSFWQLRRDDGLSLERSRNLAAANLELPWEPGDPDGQLPRYDELGGASAAKLLGRSGRLRVVTMPGQTPQGERFELQLAVDDRPVSSAIASTCVVLTIGWLATMLVGSAVSWHLARRLAAQIADIEKQLSSVTPSSLGRRIDVLTKDSDLGQMIDRLNRMLDGLEDAFQAQDHFLGNVAHELKSPLASLGADAQMLAGAAAGSEAERAAVVAIQSKLESLGRTVDSLLVLARCEAHPDVAKFRELSLNETLTDAVCRCDWYARARGVNLVTTLLEHAEREPIVRGHPELLCILFENIIRNGIAHSPRGGTVTAVLKQDNGSFVLCVQDQGPGIPADSVPEAFERFASFPSKHKSRHGIGLGLAISSRIAKVHSGSIDCATDPEQGCDFVVRLPVAAPQKSVT